MYKILCYGVTCDCAWLWGPNQGKPTATVHQLLGGNNTGLSKGQANIAWFTSTKGLCQTKFNEFYHSLALLRFKEGPLSCAGFCGL